VPGGGEHRHVHPDLGNDGLGGPLAHPGDGVQPVPSGSERGEHPVDVGVEFGDRGLQLLQVRHGQADEQRVVATKAAPQGLTQLGLLGPQPALGQLGQHLGWHCCIWRPLKPASPLQSLNAIDDAKIDFFEHFWQPSGWEAAPLCYPPTAPSGQMQQCRWTNGRTPEEVLGKAKQWHKKR
jgi:hypothetical protein